MSTSVASVVSHFPSAEDGFSTTLASTISSGATTVTLNSVAGYANGEIAVFIIDPADATKKQAFTGVIDTAGVQVTNVIWTSGTNQSHTAGATVVDYATATHISMVTKGLLVQHKQDGTHANTITTDTINENTAANGVTVDGLNIKDSKLNTNNSVVTANITDLAVTTAKINDDAVTAAKMVNGQIYRRQGGNASNWQTSGTTNYDVSASDVKIQCGAIACNASPTNITFPVAFTNTPLVFVTTSSATSQNVFVRVTAQSTTGCSLQAITDGGAASTTENANWMAIGI